MPLINHTSEFYAKKEKRDALQAKQAKEKIIQAKEYKKHILRERKANEFLTINLLYRQLWNIDSTWFLNHPESFQDPLLNKVKKVLSDYREELLKDLQARKLSYYPVLDHENIEIIRNIVGVMRLFPEICEQMTGINPETPENFRKFETIILTLKKQLECIDESRFKPKVAWEETVSALTKAPSEQKPESF